ncbi:SWEET family sugar transporter [Patescibacteria group bacterium]|nr:SWEET family sugar transporter [Patescibacteria group bacterium]MBU1758065.1 SWEET family sugar transporter [Patescibacteria group bacterium]
MEHIIGEIFRFFALVMVCWGVPRQIIKQYKENRFGMDFYFSLVICAVYFFRTWYGILKNDWYIIIPDSVGLILSIVIVYQRFNPRPIILRYIAKIFKRD